ncbi:MAG: 23S rRNA (guanosine(2251)-2'-O)-methyltransferase RlmB [Candidatus Onthovivens sp.]
MLRIYGTNPIKAALEAKTLIKVLVSLDYKNKGLIESIKKKNIPVEVTSKQKLDSLVKENHQGIIAYQKDIYTVGLDEIISISMKKPNPIIVMLDELSDPHNLGAILRSADAFDCAGIVYKKKGSVSLNDTVAKVSTGAINFVKCAEVTNLSSTIKKLKEKGFWVVGLDGDSDLTLKDAPKKVPLCLVVGSEGFGISRLVKSNCDLIAKIPMFGRVNCLNASVATSIALFALKTQ